MTIDIIIGILYDNDDFIEEPTKGKNRKFIICFTIVISVGALLYFGLDFGKKYVIEKSIEKFELLEQKIFYNKTVTNSPLTLRLKKKVLTEEYFIIRFAFEPKSSSSSALDFSIEKYTDSPKYQNDTEIIDKNLTVNGMRRVKVKYYTKYLVKSILMMYNI